MPECLWGRPELPIKEHAGHEEDRSDMSWWWVALSALNVVLAALLLAVLLRMRRGVAVEASLGGALAEERRARRTRALDIHDNVVQGLVTAKLSLELGEAESGMAALEHTLVAARTLVTELLGDGDPAIDLRDGALRRGVAAGPVA